jgi:hypothetical protein
MQATLGLTPTAQRVADLDLYRQPDVQENDMTSDIILALVFVTAVIAAIVMLFGA